MKWCLVICVVLLPTQSSSRSILDMETELALRMASISPGKYAAPAMYAANIFAGSYKPKTESSTGVYQRIANNIAEKLTTPITRWFGGKKLKNPNVESQYIDILRPRHEPDESEMIFSNRNKKGASRRSFTIPLPSKVKHFSTSAPRQQKNYLKDPYTVKVLREERANQTKRENAVVENQTKPSKELLQNFIEQTKNKNTGNQNSPFDYINNINSFDAESKNAENYFNNGGGEVNNPVNGSANVENKTVEQTLKYILDLKSTTNIVPNTTELPINLSTIIDTPSTLTTRYFVRIRVPKNNDDLEFDELGANEGQELTLVSILELLGGAIYNAFEAIGSMFARRKGDDKS